MIDVPTEEEFIEQFRRDLANTLMKDMGIANPVVYSDRTIESLALLIEQQLRLHYRTLARAIMVLPPTEEDRAQRRIRFKVHERLDTITFNVDVTPEDKS